MIDGTIEPYSFRMGVCQNIVGNVATYDSLLRYAYSFLKHKRSFSLDTGSIITLSDSSAKI